MEEKYYTIQAETMKKAITYMPISDKIVLSKTIAENSIDYINRADLNTAGDNLLHLPQRAKENISVKNMQILHVLLTYYLKEEIDTITLEKYDYYAGGIIMNQLERFKGDSEFKFKAFDLLTDFKEFKQMVNTEIHYMLENINDGIDRFTASIELLSSPETINQAMEYLKSIDVEKKTAKKTTKKKEEIDG